MLRYVCEAGNTPTQYMCLLIKTNVEDISFITSNVDDWYIFIHDTCNQK